MFVKKFLDLKNAKQGNRSRKFRRSADYSQLEPRQMLVAGITFDAGTVFIEGSNANDRAMVSLVDESTISVSLTGVESQQFEVDEVNLIRFRGLDGNDRFTNQTDINSTAFGNNGDDRLEGGGGHNRFQGGDGDDVLVGGDRNDSLRGRDGNDVIMGGRRHDRIFGGDGDDVLRGEHGRDRIRGEGGNDRLVGGNDDDNLDGGEGDDILNGNNDNDRLSGGDGDDMLRGGDGDDQASGGQGEDVIQGHAGNDELDGDAGEDQIDGGEGNDVIFGGLGTKNIVEGGAGEDRLLLIEGDRVLAADRTDAQFEFVNTGSLLDGGFWVADHIKAVDEAFAQISERTGGSVGLLLDTTSNDPIRFVKGNSVEPSNVVEDGVRTISISEWELADEDANLATITSVIHQTALTWAEPSDANSRFSGIGDIIGQFRAVSLWQEGTTIPEGFTASSDGEWYYLDGTEFVDQRGRENPFTDWATVWELAFDATATDLDLERLGSKLTQLDSFFEAVT